MSHRGRIGTGRTSGGGGGGLPSSLGGLGAIHDLRIIFHGIDRVSNVADSIQSKVRALGGAIAVLGGGGLLVTNLAAQFGVLSKTQAEALDKTFALVAASGSLISIFARLIPVLQSVASATSIANAARAISLALSGPVGWAILAGAVTALAAFGIYELGFAGGGGGVPARSAGGGAANAANRLGRGQFGLDTMVAGPTMFLAGEAGRERVTITPEGRTGPGTGGISANITITGAGDPAAVAKAVKRELEKLIDRERMRRS